ncbi:putative ribonuclease H-like domain-containing protein [Tanacetum coccineum]
MYCLVVTDDFSRFSWVFFLATKDETFEILKTFIIGIENLIDLRVKVIRCDNGTEFKNRVMNQFCEMKGIKREFSVARTPQQNEVVERKNRTLIEAARTMLADSKLPTTFWAEAVNTACYVQNRVLVIKPHNKTPYELFLGRKPALSFMRPFGCPVTILNTIDHLGKFDGKADEGFFVGYSTNSKAFRVFNSRTRIVEENLHVQFSENTSNIAGSGPNWLFDIDALTNSMNYKPVVAGNQSNGNACTKACDDAGKARMETIPRKDYILLPMWPVDLLFSHNSKDSPDARFKPSGEEEKIDAKDPGNESGNLTEGKDSEVPKVNVVDPKTSIKLPNDPNMPKLEDIVYSADDEDIGAEADMNKDHPADQIIGDLNSAPQTRRMTKNLKEHEGIDYDEVFSPIARIEAIRLFLAYASFKDYVVYQMDVKSAFLYGKIEEEVYVCQQLGFEDSDFPDRVSERTDRQNLVYQKEPSDVKIANTPMETHKPLLKDADGEDVDEHMYRSMIGSLMYLTSLRPDILFVVCVCAKFQVNPKVSHLHAVKRIFRYLKGQPKLGLWYPKDSPFDLEAYTDSDYAGASLDRKSTTGVKNPVFHSNTKHIEIRHHFIRDSNEKKLIQMIKIHTNKNVADLLTKAFDKRIGVNDGDSKLMLLGINLLLLEKVNAATHNLLLMVFWTSAKVKTVNGERHIQALVDKKKVIIFETSIRSDLKLDDAEGTDCLPTTTIFAELERIGHKEVYVTPSHTKKVFANMKRPCKGFSRRVTPLFSTMMVQATEDMVNVPAYKEKVLDLEKAKTAQVKEITSLKKRVKQLEKRSKSRPSELRRLSK